MEAWYIASYSFNTKYGTTAQASGYGRTYGEAIADCIKDYNLIISL